MAWAPVLPTVGRSRDLSRAHALGNWRAPAGRQSKETSSESFRRAAAYVLDTILIAYWVPGTMRGL